MKLYTNKWTYFKMSKEGLLRRMMKGMKITYVFSRGLNTWATSNVSQQEVFDGDPIFLTYKQAGKQYPEAFK